MSMASGNDAGALMTPSTERPLKVLVVDDALMYRTIVSEVLSGLPGVTVVGTASNGKIATQRIQALQPDLLTLDIEMPEMDGLQVLEWMRENAPEVGAVVLSSFARKGGDMTVKALSLGAFDFIQKSDGGTMAANKTALKAAIAPMLRAYARRREVRAILNGRPDRPALKPKAEALLKSAGSVRRLGTALAQRASIIGIGISTGGPEALARLLPMIPGDIGVPILVVQHMPAAFTQSITSSLDAKSAISVRAAADGEVLVPNTALFAPGGKQMKVERKADGKTAVVRVTDDHPENNCKPSADYLFRSLAHQYGARAAGVIMTGMGSDGTIGLKLMKHYGAMVIAQNEETCTVFGMPKAPIEAGIVDVIAPLDKLAEEIRLAVRGKP